jgi:hypothetical protein
VIALAPQIEVEADAAVTFSDRAVEVWAALLLDLAESDSSIEAAAEGER